MTESTLMKPSASCELPRRRWGAVITRSFRGAMVPYMSPGGCGSLTASLKSRNRPALRYSAASGH